MSICKTEISVNKIFELDGDDSDITNLSAKTMKKLLIFTTLLINFTFFTQECSSDTI